MSCEKELTLEHAGTIWWGIVDALTPFNLEFMTDGDLDTLLGAINSEDGFYRNSSVGYEFDGTTSTGNQVGMIVVPAAYPVPDAVNGFQFGFGMVGSPTDDVLTFEDSVDANTNYTDLNRIGNFFTDGYRTGTVFGGTISSNGWWYQDKTYNTDDYKFYFFSVVVSAYQGVVSNIIAYERTTNVAKITLDVGVAPPSIEFLANVSIPEDTSFDNTFVVMNNVVPFTEWTFTSVGLDVPPSVSASGLLGEWVRGTDWLADWIPDPDFTLFVTVT